ncbi:hypothetical protein SRB5_54260 [Streptomyces sp. RB5]|uniref:Uncharacterized protein n=2 Tax=Streptomyces smaragdinus TaxID=2585196 RepID=A0A7K0CP25_9ACTN|nr:hypothetical protein [Streptomyces smaragdinus]
MDADAPDGVLWSFTPDGDPRYADLDPATSWEYVSEAKLRIRRRKPYVLTTASKGFAAVVEYPTGRPYWARALTPDLNLHSIELVPHGNIAVVGSTGGVLRIYAAHNDTYAEAPLEDAHGLQWDARLRVLWALGRHELVAYRVQGTADRPEIKRGRSAELPHPDGDHAGGHDLGQVAGNPDRLWVTTRHEVLQYSKKRREFVKDYPGAARTDREDVKSIGSDHRSGRLLSTSPEDGLHQSWWTTSVRLDEPTGAVKLADGGIYKARWWDLSETDALSR